MPEAHRQPPSPTAPHQIIGSVVASFVLTWAMMPIVALRAAGAVNPGSVLAPSVDTVNPNAASWAELTLLPGIGESTARRIVARRASDLQGPRFDSGTTYNRAADLEQVRGIGPKTVQRIAPYLRFTD